MTHFDETGARDGDAVFLAGMLLLGTRRLPLLIKHIARLGSRELFLLAIAAIALGVGYGTHLVGLSFAFGAFVAGMVLSESDYGHQALSDIIPLRDLFGLLFFASVGMLLDPVFLWDHIVEVLVLVLAVSAGKGVIFAALSKAFRYGNVIPLAVGLGLFQVGEFSFVLATVGLSTRSIDHDVYALILTTAVLTMILTPFVSGQTARLYSPKRRVFKHEQLETPKPPRDRAEPTRGHRGWRPSRVADRHRVDRLRHPGGGRRARASPGRERAGCRRPGRAQLRSAEHQFDLHWVLLPPGSALAGQSIGAVGVRKKTGASVVGVVRDEELLANPEADFRFRVNDLAAIIGTEEAYGSFLAFAISSGEAGPAADQRER